MLFVKMHIFGRFSAMVARETTDVTLFTFLYTVYYKWKDSTPKRFRLWWGLGVR